MVPKIREDVVIALSCPSLLGGKILLLKIQHNLIAVQRNQSGTDREILPAD